MNEATESVSEEQKALEETRKAIEQHRAMYEALNNDTSRHVVSFREYQRKESGTWAEAVNLLKSVVHGEKTVSDAVIEECRAAVMRLNQIQYVLGQRMLPIGAVSPDVLEAVMDVLRRIGDDTMKAENHLSLILGWQAKRN